MPPRALRVRRRHGDHPTAALSMLRAPGAVSIVGLRSDLGSRARAATYELTTRLFFDDGLTDRVFTQAPYSARGARDTRNAQDSIYGGTTALLLAITADGSGGCAGTFDLDLAGMPATRTAGGACAALAATLPLPSATTDRTTRRVAGHLRGSSPSRPRRTRPGRSASRSARSRMRRPPSQTYYRNNETSCGGQRQGHDEPRR